MSDPSILKRLQDGALDFDAAFEMIASRAVGGQDEPAVQRPRRGDADAAILRSREGKVVLSAVDAPSGEGADSLPRRKVTLEAIALPRDSARTAASARAVISARDESGGASAGSSSEPEGAPSATDTAYRGAIDDDVVEVSTPGEAVALITLRDEGQRNMFTEPMVRGVKEALRDVAARQDVKAVVVQGHGSWFCTGGTPDTLRAIREGRMSFLDDDVFRALLDCPLPTIAAMQGHALGGGCTFGLYADVIVMAESAFYAANFMEHGFTPGVGATLLFPYKLGNLLGAEMLLTARRYQGRELAERGAPAMILPADQVLPRALDAASELASRPRLQLLRLKAHLASPLRAALPEVLSREQAMHDEIFAGTRALNETRRR